MLIKIKTEYTKELLLKYARFNEYRKAAQIATYIMLEFVMLSIALMFIFTSENQVELMISIFIILPVVLLIIPGIIYILPFFVVKLSKNVIGAVNTYEFSEEEIIIDSSLPNSAGQTKANYNYFERIYETKDEFYLFVSKIQAFVIRKSDITDGSISDLQELFKKKLPSNKYIDKSKSSKFMPAFLITISAVIVLTAICSFFNITPGDANKKVFSDAGLSITLTDKFHKKDFASYTDVYSSQDIAVFVLKEEKTQFPDKNISLNDYAYLVLENNKLDTTIDENDGLTTFTFEKNKSGKDYTYFGVVYKGDDAFWIVQFTCETAKYESLKPKMIKYAKSVAL